MTEALNSFFGSAGSGVGGQGVDAGILTGLHTVATDDPLGSSGDHTLPFPDLVSRLLSANGNEGTKPSLPVTTHEASLTGPDVLASPTGPGSNGTVANRDESSTEFEHLPVTVGADDPQDRSELTEGQWFGLFGHFERESPSPSPDSDGDRPDGSEVPLEPQGNLTPVVAPAHPQDPIPTGEAALEAGAPRTAEAHPSQIRPVENPATTGEGSTGPAEPAPSADATQPVAVPLKSETQTVATSADALRTVDTDKAAANPSTTQSVTDSSSEADAAHTSDEAEPLKVESNQGRSTATESLNSAARSARPVQVVGQQTGQSLDVAVMATHAGPPTTADNLADAASISHSESVPEAASTGEFDLTSEGDFASGGDEQDTDADPQGQILNRDDVVSTQSNTASHVRESRESVSAQVVSTILDRAEWQQNAAETVLRVKLDPPELGEIMLRLQRRANGEVSVEMRARDPQTAQLVGEGVAEIRSALEQAGVQTGEMTVLLDQGHGGGADHSSHSYEELMDEDSEVPTANAETRRRRTPRGRDGVMA